MAVRIVAAPAFPRFRLFNNPLGSVKVVRDLGLLLFDVLPPAKSALAALSLGVTGRLPRLARGVPLA
jgi:2-octaprenyl-6-methoxyphenol hydroxylase